MKVVFDEYHMDAVKFENWDMPLPRVGDTVDLIGNDEENDMYVTLVSFDVKSKTIYIRLKKPA